MTITFGQLTQEVDSLYNIVSDSNFRSDQLIYHAMRWYSGFVRKTAHRRFNISVGTQFYPFAKNFEYFKPKGILDDNGKLLLPYDIFSQQTNLDFYTIHTETEYQICFRNTPTRARRVLLMYTRSPIVPAQYTDSDVLDVSASHLYVINSFVEALASSKKTTSFIWGALPPDYESYFLGQTSDEGRRAWGRCLSFKEEIDTEKVKQDTNIFHSWDVMSRVDAISLNSQSYSHSSTFSSSTLGGASDIIENSTESSTETGQDLPVSRSLVSRHGTPTDLVFSEGEHVDISQSDHTVSANLTQAIYIGGTGALNVELSDGTNMFFATVIAGTILPISVKKIYSSSTTATNLVVFW